MNIQLIVTIFFICAAISVAISLIDSFLRARNIIGRMTEDEFEVILREDRKELERGCGLRDEGGHS